MYILKSMVASYKGRNHKLDGTLMLLMFNKDVTLSLYTI